MNSSDILRTRAKALNLHGLLAHWPEVTAAGWFQTLLDWEDQERARRSVKRTFSVSDACLVAIR